tara:strand:- start:9378 stop:9677 length:300 start_codon:yes stop_codon:yes gene_type:complete
MSLRTVPIRRCGNRPNLFMGGDRELVMFSGLLSAILVLATQDFMAIGMGLVIWFFAIRSLRMMAKADPFMRSVYLKQRKYQKYYPARSTPFRENRRGYE